MIRGQIYSKRKRLKKLRNAKADLIAILSKEENEGVIRNELLETNRQIQQEIELVKSNISKCKLQKATELLHVLDKKRFRKRIIKDLCKSVPLFNLGLSGIKMFKG